MREKNLSVIQHCRGKLWGETRLSTTLTRGREKASTDSHSSTVNRTQYVKTGGNMRFNSILELLGKKKKNHIPNRSNDVPVTKNGSCIKKKKRMDPDWETFMRD